ncbi:hypothetical protein CAEBREN_23591 [Caenorhabditis brenneri]|uniref:Serpentine Receptor, class E (Epsilon) n=1 Tax=Caenorhabditis brenneri TaxID=135651 RepID=G0MTW6_CAEBE|nr:hypothetical protein CAEBREN_23591 [Caenorhabditis brenneri]
MFKFLFGFAFTGYYDYEMAAHYTLQYMVFYMLILIIAFVVTCFGIRIALPIRAYHSNVARLFCFALAMWLIIFISKICVFLYHIRVEKKFDNTDPSFIFLQVSLFARYFYFFFGSAAPLASTVERGFATLFLSSYEKSSNFRIFLLISITNVTLALCFTTLTIFVESQLNFILIVPLTYLLICFVLLSFLYRFNLSQVNKLNKYHREEYTLSRRFQLKENIRILLLLMKLIYAAVAFIAIIVAGYTLPIFLKFGNLTSDFMRTVMDFCVHCNPFIVIPMTTFFIPEFRKSARASLFKKCSLARCKADSKYRSYREDSNQADIYFDLFKKSIKKIHVGPVPKRF